MASSELSLVNRALEASCDLLKPAKYQRSLAVDINTTAASAVVHSAPMCSASKPPLSPANSVSPAQNDGSSGVTGDCSVEKKSVTSGSDCTDRSCSGRM